MIPLNFKKFKLHFAILSIAAFDARSLYSLHLFCIFIGQLFDLDDCIGHIENLLIGYVEKPFFRL